MTNNDKFPLESSPPPLELETTTYNKNEKTLEQNKLEEREREVLSENDYARRYREIHCYEENDGYEHEEHRYIRNHDGKRQQPFFRKHSTVSPYKRQRDEYIQEIQKIRSFPNDTKYPSNTSSPVSMVSGFAHAPYTSRLSQQHQQHRQQREKYKQQQIHRNTLPTPPLREIDRQQEQRYYERQQWNQTTRQTVKVPSSNPLEMNLKIIERSEEAIKISLVVDGVKYYGTLDHQ
jgi:hypothetical protein